MIDLFFRWASFADAKADIVWLAQHYSSVTTTTDATWQSARDRCIPDVTVWRPSQDTTSTSTDGGIIHHPLSGWSAVVALDTVPAAVMNSTNLAFALNRDGPPYLVKNNIGGIITDVAVSPIFAGSHYPLGGYSSST